MKHAGRRLTVLALFAVVALTTTGMARSTVAASGQAAHAPCHGAPTTPKPPSGPCGSLSPLPCCNQPFLFTTTDALDVPSLTFALISSAPTLFPPITQVANVMLAPARAAPSTTYHSILRL